MAAGDIHYARIPVTLDYLAVADTALTFVDITGSFISTEFDILTSTIVNVSGKNSTSKAVVTIVGREIL